MDFLGSVLDLMLHLDTRIAAASAEYGAYLYAILFFVIFAETGLVIAAALPSDTVLFAAGALAAQSVLSVWLLFFGGMLAAFLGDQLDYAVGVWLGKSFFATRELPGLRHKHFWEARRYYAKYGGATVIAGRFVPVLRCVAPLAGGMVGMPWRRFMIYNALGKLVWTPLFVFGGYFLGRIPWIAENFAMVILAALGLPFVMTGVRLAWVTLLKNYRLP